MPLDFTKLDRSVLEPALDSSLRKQGGRHFVHIYDDEGSLVDGVATFLSLGLQAGDAAVVIARENHIASFEEALELGGVDLGAARERGRWRAVRSRELLADFMVDGMPEPSRFMDSIAELILPLRAARVRVFGEMVADLWKDGRIPAAMRIEELWNDLGSIFDIELFCAYPAASIQETELVSLTEVCRQHTQVIPPARKEHP